MKSNTAILIFAQTSTEVLRQKGIYKGEKLFETLNKKTVQTAKQSGLPYYLYTEKLQKGNSFGQRFVNAVSEVFSKGYERVIAIGNDSPQLKKQHIVYSCEQLNSNQLVLGPSVDGGFYLIGLHKSLFDAKKFIKLPWQSGQLCKSIINHLANDKQTSFCQLSTLYDIDTAEDVKKVIRYSFQFSRTLKTILSYIVSTVISRRFWHVLNIFQENKYHSTSYNKGSPLYFS